MATRLPIVFHPDYEAPLRPGHPFPMSKYGYLRRALITRDLLPEAGGYLAPAPLPAGPRAFTPRPMSIAWRTPP